MDKEEALRLAGEALLAGDSCLSLIRHRAANSVPWERLGLEPWEVDQAIGKMRKARAEIAEASLPDTELRS